jgi:hypothetical protein
VIFLFVLVQKVVEEIHGVDLLPHVHVT